MLLSIKTCIGIFVLAFILATSFTSRVEASLVVANPDWNMDLTDYGYSDFLLDNRPGFEGREYLSGEWGAAVGYTKGTDEQTSPVWFEEHFEFPDWTTNSNFSVNTAIHDTGATNADGFTVYSSTIANTDIAVTMTYEMLDTITGIAMGDEHASSGGAGASTASDRYVLKQTYGIENISGVGLTDVNLFQFLHGLNSTVALYDDRDYGGILGDYHFDTTLWGESYDEDGNLHEDTISFHSSVAPVAWESGGYGVEGIDSHETGKPTSGVHLSIEGDVLSGVDLFAPSELWVSGAQKYLLGELAHGESATFDVLLSLNTVTTPVPEPATVALLGIGLVGMAGAEVRRRRKKKAVDKS